MNYLSMGTTKREALFRNTFEMALENPKGVGVNNFEYLHPKYANLDTRPSPYVSDSTILRTPHNISLKMFSEVGYIGGIVFILIVLSILWSGLKSAYFGTYTEKWLFVALFALLFHAHFSAVFLTPGSLFFAVLLFSFSFAVYSVGQTVSISDQQQSLEVCNGEEPNGETDGEMSLYDYNGDYNGGAYFVIHIDMAASW